MSNPSFITAQFERSAETITAEFRLTLDNPLHEVWAELTEPERLARWLAPGSIQPRTGGWARFAFEESGGVIDSQVMAFEPQRLLAYSWSSPGEPLRPLVWELHALGPMTTLRLRLSVPAREDAARAAAGWAAHLEMLWASLIGVPIKFPYGVFKAAREAYADQLAQTNASRWRMEA